MPREDNFSEERLLQPKYFSAVHIFKPRKIRAVSGTNSASWVFAQDWRTSCMNSIYLWEGESGVSLHFGAWDAAVGWISLCWKTWDGDLGKVLVAAMSPSPCNVRGFGHHKVPHGSTMGPLFWPPTIWQASVGKALENWCLKEQRNFFHFICETSENMSGKIH